MKTVLCTFVPVFCLAAVAILLLPAAVTGQTCDSIKDCMRGEDKVVREADRVEGTIVRLENFVLAGAPQTANEERRLNRLCMRISGRLLHLEGSVSLLALCCGENTSLTDRYNDLMSRYQAHCPPLP